MNQWDLTPILFDCFINEWMQEYPIVEYSCVYTLEQHVFSHFIANLIAGQVSTDIFSLRRGTFTVKHLLFAISVFSYFAAKTLLKC